MNPVVPHHHSSVSLGKAKYTQLNIGHTQEIQHSSHHYNDFSINPTAVNDEEARKSVPQLNLKINLRHADKKSSLPALKTLQRDYNQSQLSNIVQNVKAVNGRPRHRRNYESHMQL